MDPVPRSLTYATDLDVLPRDHVVEDGGDHLVVRSPGNPGHYWGNFLLFRDAPAPGDGERWEALFAEAFASEPRVRHRTFGWDRVDGAAGAAAAEFAARGYRIDDVVGLVAEPHEVAAHPRANREVIVRRLDPDGDGALWDEVVELLVTTRDVEHEEGVHRTFLRTRMAERRELLRSGHGGWYVALDPGTGAVAATCGVVVTAGRGRFQDVATAEEHRRRGICSRLVVDAAREAVETDGARRLVIVADVAYHALGLYESLGFRRQEHVFGACRAPAAGAAPA